MSNGSTEGAAGPTGAPTNRAEAAVGALSQKLANVRKTQAAIRATIAGVQEQLERIRAMPGEKVFITRRWARTIQDLRSPFRTLREALEHDLKVLRSELTQLRGAGRGLEKRIRRQTVLSDKFEFDAKLDDILEAAKERGELDSEDLAGLSESADKVLRGFVALVEDDPHNHANIEGLLSWVEREMVVGMEGDDARREVAFGALRGATDERRKKADDDFRRSPTTAAFGRLLDEEILHQTVGGTGSLLARPRPPGMRAVRPGTVHTVRPGETLARISKRYYGTPRYWDWIYVRNHDVVGDDPERLPIGVRLTIP